MSPGMVRRANTMRVLGLGVLLAWGSTGAQGLPYHNETCSQDGVVCLIIEQPDAEKASISLRTTARSDLTLTLDAKLENVETSVPLPVTTVFHGSETRTVVEFKHGRHELAWWYRDLRYHWLWGNSRATHEDSVLYRLPFVMNRPIRIIQGNNGEFSHNGLSRYAVDFDLPEGSPVHAAREGVVVEVVQDYSSAGTDASYREWDKANRVMVRHVDGTLGYYGHLKPGGVVVSVGETVSAGQRLALSGNTGYSSGPHLHFEVRKPRDGHQYETVPVRFNTEQGLGITLEQGLYYTNAH